MSQPPDHHEHDQHTQDDEVDEQLDNQLDQQLLARLRGADSAAPLLPLSQDALDVLLQATTSTPRTSVASTGSAATSAHTAPTTTAGTIEAATLQSAVVSSLADARRRRRRRTGAAGLGLAAAAAGVIAYGAGLPGLTGLSGGEPPVTALQAAPPTDGLAVACTPVDATYLAGRDLAFEGTVTDVRPVAGGEVVVLEVERVFRGDVAQRVEVSTPGAGSTVDGTVQLAQGQDYLVAAFDGTVSGCGATGPVSPVLAALYEQAFGGGS